MLRKHCHILLVHPARKLAFPGTSVLRTQLDEQELEDSGVRAPLSPMAFLDQSQILRALVGPSVFLQQILCFTEFCTA